MPNTDDEDDHPADSMQGADDEDDHPADAMPNTDDEDDHPADSMDGAIRLCVIAIVAGAAIGLIGGAFRWCLQGADHLRVDICVWAHRLPGPGWLVTIAFVALCAAAAALVVRWVPLAAGSGIPHV